jgi:hypothetical protein
MKVGQNVKDKSYLGYREGLLYGHDMVIHHLISSRKCALHYRDKRAVECGPYIGESFREADRANGLSKFVRESNTCSDVELRYVSDAKANAHTRGRHELIDLGRN